MNRTLIHIKNVSKTFDNSAGVTNIDLTIGDGEFLTLLGPSGCGKTTLLRLISGFITPDSGQILLNDQDITKLPPEKRHINMVFQSYALFPHMSVFDNIAFGPRVSHLSKQEIQRRVDDALAMVKLSHLADRKPQQLSGGQQQRVAIARAVVNEPLVLLLDEPLSALDHNLRKSMQLELKQLQRRLGITFILVTHDQEEALSMSDRVAVMNNGKIEQLDTPRKIYEQPVNLFVARFIGEANIFVCQIAAIENNQIEIEIEGVKIHLKAPPEAKVGAEINVLVRPEDIRVWGLKEINLQEDVNLIAGTVEQVIYKGSTVDLVVRLASNKLISATQFFDEDDDKLEYEAGEKVFINWMPGWEVIYPHD